MQTSIQYPVGEVIALRVPNSDPILEQALVNLSGIDQSIETWKIRKGHYAMFPFNVWSKSKSWRVLAEFEDTEGERRTFNYHCDFAPTEARIHFIVEAPHRQALIGHIGRKLRIG